MRIPGFFRIIFKQQLLLLLLLVREACKPLAGWRFFILYRGQTAASEFCGRNIAAMKEVRGSSIIFGTDMSSRRGFRLLVMELWKFFPGTK